MYRFIDFVFVAKVKFYADAHHYYCTAKLHTLNRINIITDKEWNVERELTKKNPLQPITILQFLGIRQLKWYSRTRSSSITNVVGERFHNRFLLTSVVQVPQV